MTLCSRLRPKPAVKVHTPPYVLHYQLSPSSTMQLVQLAQLAKQGEGLHENVRKTGVGLAERVACYCAIWPDEG